MHSFISRTYLVNPNRQQKEVYNFLLYVLQVIAEEMKPGKVLSEIHSIVMEKAKQKDIGLAPLLPRALAKTIGLFLEEDLFSISPDCQREILADQIFSVHLHLKIPNVEEKVSYL